MVFLTPDERKKFVEWLKQEANTSFKLVTQMLLISVPDVLIEKHKEYAKACMVVSKEIELIQEDSIKC